MLLVMGAAASPAQQAPVTPVVVVVAPGASHTVVRDYLDRAVLPRDGGFAALMRQGELAPLRPVFSPETGPSRASLWTGAQPSAHGIVGNSFRLPGEALADGSGGFGRPLQVETVLDAARRAGKRIVQLIDWPPSAVEHTGGVTFLPKPLSRSTLLEFRPVSTTSNLRWRRFGSAAAAEKPLEVSLLHGKERMQIELEGAADASYRVRIVMAARHGKWSQVKAGSWAPVSAPGGDAVSWVKVLAHPAGADGVAGRLYVGPLVQRERQAAIANFDNQHGPWPGRPEGGMLRAGRIDEATWWEQARRLHSYHLQLATFMLRRESADLYLVDMSWIDSAGHLFVAEHPRQRAFQEEGGAKKKRFDSYMEEAYRLLDQAIVALRKAAPRGARFVVVSDHGMMPAHTAIPLQRLLGGLGFVVDPANSPEVMTYSSFNSAHIYLAPSRLGDVARVADFCRSLTDPVTGETVIQEVFAREQQRQVGFSGAASGDLWIVAKPGYEIASEHDAKWSPASMAGMHGYRGDEAKNVGLLAISGSDIQATAFANINVVNFAALLGKLLGLPPRRQIDAPGAPSH